MNPQGDADYGHRRLRLKQLSGLKNLTELNLDNTKITDVGLKGLAELTNLNTLSLQHCDAITNAGLKELCGLQNLIDLNLQLCTQITDVGARDLKSIKMLKMINIVGTAISDAGVKDLWQSRETSFDLALFLGADLVRLQLIKQMPQPGISVVSRI